MSDDDNITLLKKITTATLRKGTDFIDITVKHAPKDQAIRIANAIAEAGAERKALSEKDNIKRAFRALDEEWATQEKVVNDHRTDLRTFLTYYKMPFPPDEESFLKPEEINFSDHDDPLQRSISQQVYRETLDDFNQARGMLREMKIKQQETRDLLKRPRIPITIHQRAK